VKGVQTSKAEKHQESKDDVGADASKQADICVYLK
jgi:hypothetical protein